MNLLKAGQRIVDRIKGGDRYYMEAAGLLLLTEAWDEAVEQLTPNLLGTEDEGSHFIENQETV